MRILFDKESNTFIVLDTTEIKRILRPRKGQWPPFTKEEIQQTVINSEIDSRLRDFFFSITANARPGIVRIKYHDFHAEIYHLRPDGSAITVTVPYTTCAVYWEEPNKFLEIFL